MAMLTCHECKKQVSTSAKACPGCGAKVRKPVSVIGWIGIIMMGTLAFQCQRGCNAVSEKIEDNQAKAAVAEAAKTPEQKASDQRMKDAEKKREESVINAVIALKRAAKDPDSVKFMYIGANYDASLLCITYRAKNSYGAVVPGVYTYTETKKASTSAAEFKKHCEKNIKALFDLSHFG